MIGETCSLCPPAWCPAAGQWAASASGLFKPFPFWFFFTGKIWKLSFHTIDGARKEGEGKIFGPGCMIAEITSPELWKIFFRIPYVPKFVVRAIHLWGRSWRRFLLFNHNFASGLARTSSKTCFARRSFQHGRGRTALRLHWHKSAFWRWNRMLFPFWLSVTGNKVVEDSEVSRPTPCSCKAKQFLVILFFNFSPVLKLCSSVELPALHRKLQ